MQHARTGHQNGALLFLSSSGHSHPGWFSSRSAILAKCNLLTQEILLRGLGVMKTTMKLMGRPDLSGFPGSRSRRRHLLAEWISSSFTRISLCRARHQS